MPRKRGADSTKTKPSSRARRPGSGGATVLGLDIGTSAIRVAEVCADPRHGHGPDRPPAVRVFGEVPLPPGATVDGEVADPALVGEAIKALWHQLGLKQRDVRVGLASQRVVARVIEMPAMPDDEIESAARFSAGDHIPFPLAEAVLDVSVLETVTGGDGAPMVRVLLAAAHRAPFDLLLEAAEAGGVRVVGVDLVPLAMLRALVRQAEPAPAPAPSGDDWAPEPAGPPVEALVSVGAAVTSVVVHSGGRPCFLRTVATGGQALTAGLADELGIETADAEALKVGDPGADAGLVARAGRVVEARIGSIVGEVHGSLSYWMAQSGQGLDRVLLTGGSASAGGLSDRLALMLGVPVEVVVATDHLDFEVERTGALGGRPEAALCAAGLGLGPRRTGGQPLTGRAIDLMPRDRVSSAGALPKKKLAIGAGVLLVALAGATAQRSLSLSQERSALAKAQRETADLQVELARYADVRTALRAVQTGQTTIRQALAGDIDWTSFLEDFSRQLPAGTWISALDAQRNVTTAPAAGAAPAAPAAPAAGAGTVNFTASGLGFPTVSDWLEAMAKNADLSGATVGSMTKNGTEANSTVNFSSNASLTSAAESGRAEEILDFGTTAISSGGGR